jgi:hypothetical protein
MPTDMRLLAMALDPSLLMRAAGLDPDPWQAEFVRAEDDRILLMAARQLGKSSSVAALALHTALFRPPADVLLVSPAERQSNELLLKAATFYERLGRPLGTLADSTTQLALPNRSRIMSLPGNEKTIRSFSAPRLVVIDEASRIEDAVIGAVSPMMATGKGRLVMISTPFGQRGTFYNAWEGRLGPWRRFKVVASECPRIAAEFLAGERVRLGPMWYSQEYECVFNQALNQVFSTESVLAAFGGAGAALLGGGSDAGLYLGAGPGAGPRPVGAGDPGAAPWPDWRPAGPPAP